MTVRTLLLLTTTLTAIFGLGGCASGRPALSEVEPKMRAAVLAVPGVTGGTVTLYEASLTPRALCKLTGSADTSAELSKTLDRVLAVVTEYIRPYPSGTATCTIANGDLFAQQPDLGLDEVVSFDALRKRYP